jgi:hypothetical protein
MNLPVNLTGYTYDRLVNWLKRAGSNNKEHFGTEITGGLDLQQIPEEYAHYLLWLKEYNPKTYLAIGIGNGGSFWLECIFARPEKCYAIDDLSYQGWTEQRKEVIEERLTNLQKRGFNPTFLEGDSKLLVSQVPHVDVAFIDGDHSYEGVKKDFEGVSASYKVFHDVASVNCPGVQQLWQEIKQQTELTTEFIHGDKCGIGIVQS